ncbi:hypothetical protein D3C80_2018420 [compost metagenome]
MNLHHDLWLIIAGYDKYDGIAGPQFRRGLHQVFNILRPDVATADDEQILVPASDVQFAPGQVAQITGVQPVVS